MKKYLLIFLSVALLTTSFVWSNGWLAKPVKAGAGDGTNTPVETIAELSNVIEFIENRFLGGFSLANSVTEPSSQPLASKKPIAHNSATLVEKTNMVTKELVMERDFTLYLTEDASYYVSRGFMSMETPYQTMEQSFDMLIYTDAEHVIIKFNELNMSGASRSIDQNGRLTEWEYFTTSVNPNYIGKWVALDSTTGNQFIEMLDSMNRETYNLLKEYVDSVYENEYKKNDTLYTLTKEINSGVTADIELDFSDAEEAVLDLSFTYAESKDYYALDTLKFMNVDNTVIHFDADSSSIVWDVDDLGNILEGL